MENKNIRRENLAALMKTYLDENPNSTRAGFAERCGIAPAQLSHLTGVKSYRNIGNNLARKIETSLNLPVGWMDTLQDTSQKTSTKDNKKLEFAGKLRSGKVSVIGEAILGVDGMIDMVEVRDGWLQIYSSDEEAYGLKVKGDSMYPRIQSGEFVVIEPNTHVQSGDEVFVRTIEGHNMIKIMTKTRDGCYQFSSINNEHKPITLNPREVENMHYVSAIVKATRYVDHDDTENH